MPCSLELSSRSDSKNESFTIPNTFTSPVTFPIVTGATPLSLNEPIVEKTGGMIHPPPVLASPVAENRNPAALVEMINNRWVRS